MHAVSLSRCMEEVLQPVLQKQPTGHLSWKAKAFLNRPASLKRFNQSPYNRDVKIIISPAKKMSAKNDSPFALTTPRFKSRRDELTSLLADMNPADLQKIYACSDRTFAPVYEELQRQKAGIFPEPTPALLAYEGIAFRCMAPGVFTDVQWNYVCRHLRILSAIYGVLEPLDGIYPYRLEMAQKLPFSLYEYWGDSLFKALDDDLIINLASKEYADAIRPYARLIDVRFFEEDENGTRKEKGVYAKMARGSMVRYMAEHEIKTPESLRGFDTLGYRYDEKSSTPDCLIFVRPETESQSEPARPKTKRKKSPAGSRSRKE